MNDWVDAEEELTKELCFRGTEMTNDRELLEQAAKAAGYEIQGKVEKMIAEHGHYAGGFVITNSKGGSSAWNPLTDDGDALRLAVKLGMDVNIENTTKNLGGCTKAWYFNGTTDWYIEEAHNDAPYAATRRAIVRAAAELGKTNNAEWIEYRGRSND